MHTKSTLPFLTAAGCVLALLMVLGLTASCGPGGATGVLSAGPTEPEPEPEPESPVDPGSAATWLCRVKVLSDAQPDTTSIDTILESITTPGMTDEERCMAVYEFVHGHRFWYPPAAARELGRPVTDPVLIANCYPTTICEQDAAVTGALWAGLGYDVRFWQLGGHTPGEVFYDESWHCFDATLGLVRWYVDDGVKNVPDVQPLYKPDESYVERFDGYEVGHRMDLTLRAGETFTRSWTLLSEEPDYWRPAGLDGRFPDDRDGVTRNLEDILELKPYRVDMNGSGVCNGLWVFRPDFSDARWPEVFESANYASGSGRSVTAEPGKSAELVWRMRTPYVITGAWVEGDIMATHDAPVEFHVSVDHGETWQSLGSVPAGRQSIPLREYVAGGFSYLLRLRMGSTEQDAAGVSDLTVRTVVQLSPFGLPALQMGENRIHVSVGEQVETLTVCPNLESSDYRRGLIEETNIVTAREQEQPQWVRGLCAREAGRESVLIYRVEAPGPIQRVRWGGRVRSDEQDVNELYWSTDGVAWHEQELTYRWTYPESDTLNLYPAHSETTDDLPEGARTVYLKYRFVRPAVPADEPWRLNLVTGIRIDVDYVPQAATGSGPIDVTYSWDEEENGALVERMHTERVVTLPHDYTIHVGGDEKPLMRWVRMEIAPSR